MIVMIVSWCFSDIKHLAIPSAISLQGVLPQTHNRSK